MVISSTRHGARSGILGELVRAAAAAHTRRPEGIAKGLATVGHSSAGLLVHADPGGVAPGPGGAGDPAGCLGGGQACDDGLDTGAGGCRARGDAAGPPVGSGTAAAVLALVLAACAGCTSGGSSRGTSSGTTPAAAPAAAAGGGVPLQQDYVSAIRRVLPSVVEIKTASGLGSGVVYDTAGHIVTNAHVVGTATSFQVFLAGSATPLPARLTGSYPPDDLAVIQVTGAAHLVPAHFADSSKLQVGDIVLAMGNPLGLASSVDRRDHLGGRADRVRAAGRRVAGRDLARCDPDLGGDQPRQQRRGPGRPGRPGGGHPHAGGHRPAAGRRRPRDRVRHPLQHRHRYRRADHQDRPRHQLPPRGPGRRACRPSPGPTASPRASGIAAVTPGGPAAKAGLRPGDVITAVNGTATPDTETLAAVLAGLHPGQQVPVSVTKADGSTATVHRDPRAAARLLTSRRLRPIRPIGLPVTCPIAGAGVSALI